MKHRLSRSSISGTLLATFGEKCPSKSDDSPCGFTIAVAIGENTRAPSPKPPIIIPEMSPG